jgi:hypothetical protein
VVTACNLLAATLDTHNNNWAKSCGFSGWPNRSVIEEQMVFNW